VAVSFDPIDLPHFADRLPELASESDICAENLETGVHKSYLPAFERLHAFVHGLKGVTKILQASTREEKFICDYNEALLLAIKEEFILERRLECAGLLRSIANQLRAAKFLGREKVLEEFKALYVKDLNHEERMQFVPSGLAYVNEFVSKRAREAHLLELREYFLESTISLEELPRWQEKIQIAMNEGIPRAGLFINFLPFIQTERSKEVRAWAWVGVDQDDDEFADFVKEIIPDIKVDARKN
jgi:hypothetical protein